VDGPPARAMTGRSVGGSIIWAAGIIPEGPTFRLSGIAGRLGRGCMPHDKRSRTLQSCAVWTAASKLGNCCCCVAAPVHPTIRARSDPDDATGRMRCASRFPLLAGAAAFVETVWPAGATRGAAISLRHVSAVSPGSCERRSVASRCTPCVAAGSNWSPRCAAIHQTGTARIQFGTLSSKWIIQVPGASSRQPVIYPSRRCIIQVE